MSGGRAEEVFRTRSLEMHVAFDRLRAWCVEDIIEATERALQFVGEMDAAAFKVDERTSAAVLHQVFIIGEAAARLPDGIRSRAANVRWDEIIGMRNIIAHGYFDVDLEVAWKTVRVDLPPPRDEMRRLLASEQS